ncbi:MAG: hypothetical protein CMF28_00075 [Kiritimatiellaceae bacterium]|nr:hypothetical protein [Kiritimatiellaceae bacterium]
MVDEQVESLAVWGPLEGGGGIGGVGVGGEVELVFPEECAGGAGIDFIRGDVLGVVEGFEAGLMGAVGGVEDLIVLGWG